MKKTIKLSEFDAELNTDVVDSYTNMNLTLTLRLGFNQLNPTGGAAKGTYPDAGDFHDPSAVRRKTIKWEPGPWAQWKKTFASTAEKFWHGKFWLVNSSRLFAIDEECTYYIPNVYCQINIIAQDGTASNNHHVIDVVRLDSSESFFGSHSTLYDSLDIKPVQKNTDSKGKKVMQRAHVHEVGHLLGLGHVNEGKANCPKTGDTNLPACYGVTDQEMHSVMGSGMQLRTAHAAPWQMAMQRFAFAESVQSIFSPPSPQSKALDVIGVGPLPALQQWHAKKQRIYPRTPDQVAKGLLLATRPNR